MTRRGLLLFSALGLIWGVPFLFIKIAVTELTPEMLVLARCATAAMLLIPLAVRRRAIAPVLHHWKALLAFTIVEIVLPWYFVGAAEIKLPSSTVGLLLSAVPLIAVGIAPAFGRHHRITLLNAIGIAFGMIGVAVIVGFDRGGSDLLSIAQLGVVVAGYALGPAILARWMSDLPGVGVIAAALAASTIIYIPIVLLSGGWQPHLPSAPVIGSVLVLGVLCTAIAFLLMFALIAEIGPIRMTAITYVNPAVAIVAGAVVLAEPISPWTIAGFILILLGCFLVTRPQRQKVNRPNAPRIAES